MRFLALTFDAGGNLPPLLGLIEALVARGHVVDVFGHDTQRPAIETAGAAFVAFEHAPQRDAGAPADPNMAAWLQAFDSAAAVELLAAASARDPDVLIVDALTPSTLTAANASAWPSVALCHTPYQTLADFLDGRFRAPMEGADLVLIVSYEAFHAGAPAPASAIFAGPVRPSASVAWSPGQPGRPLVLASLSTAQQDQAPVLGRLCEALCGVDAEVLVTTGRGIEPTSLPAAPHMTVVRAVPHEAVLPHADLLITHAGHGTVMAAATAGVPMLCLPGRGDQPANAARVAELGLGEVIDTAAEPDVLRNAIARLLNDDALRRRCRDFAEMVASQRRLGLAVERLEALGR